MKIGSNPCFRKRMTRTKKLKLTPWSIKVVSYTVTRLDSSQTWKVVVIHRMSCVTTLLLRPTVLWAPISLVTTRWLILHWPLLISISRKSEPNSFTALPSLLFCSSFLSSISSTPILSSTPNPPRPAAHYPKELRLIRLPILVVNNLDLVPEEAKWKAWWSVNPLALRYTLEENTDFFTSSHRRIQQGSSGGLKVVELLL